MSNPRLTVGIPTMNRPALLAKAIGSVLGQSTPTVCLIAQQGNDDATTDVLARFSGHPLVKVVPSGATFLWENWCEALNHADTELFAWLQDDDLLSPYFARRVCSAFDTFPKASVWIARLGISHIEGLGNWWESTGPLIPMDLLHGQPTLIQGALLAVGSYFTSFALSPAVAFRRTPEAIAAALSCPKDSDLYTERTILAKLGQLGPAICDPAIAGYWHQHESNESHRLVSSGDTKRQFRVMLDAVDPIVEAAPQWRDLLASWAVMAGRGQVQAFVKNVTDLDVSSPLLSEAVSVLKAALESSAS